MDSVTGIGDLPIYVNVTSQFNVSLKQLCKEKLLGTETSVPSPFEGRPSKNPDNYFGALRIQGMKCGDPTYQQLHYEYYH